MTTQDTAKLLDIKKRLENLSAADQLRVCAALLETGKPIDAAIAETLGGQVIDRLRAFRLLGVPA